MKVSLSVDGEVYVHIREIYPRESKYYRWLIHGLTQPGWTRNNVGFAWTKKGAIRAAKRVARIAGVEVQS